jgi:hypothetical protein
MVDDHRTYWTTDDEIRFIKHIGTGKWSQSRSCLAAGREKLLRNYQQAALYRKVWGKMDRGKVMKAVDAELMVYM